MGYYDKPHYDKSKAKRKRGSIHPVTNDQFSDAPPVVQSDVQVEVKIGGFMSGSQFGFGCIFAGIIFVVVLGFMCSMAISG